MPRKGYSDLIEKDPTKSVPMERKIGETKQKLAEPDRRSLQDQILQREDEMREKKEINKDADVSEMKREIDQKKMILQHDDDLTPKSDSQKDRLAARASEIAEVLKKNMPTKREMWPKPGSSESQQAVRHNIKFQDQYSDLCREWQDIQNKLNPDDPTAQSLELIRPD